jgi:hypothetical protein
MKKITNSLILGLFQEDIALDLIKVFVIGLFEIAWQVIESYLNHVISDNIFQKHNFTIIG